MTNTTLIDAAGWVNLVSAVFHLAFWRLFRWPQSLGDLNRVNRGTLYVMNWSLFYFFALFAFIFLRVDLGAAPSGLTSSLLFGMSGFYLLRALIHPYFFRLANPMSVTIIVFALAASVLHFMAASRLLGFLPS